MSAGINLQSIYQKMDLSTNINNNNNNNNSCTISTNSKELELAHKEASMLSKSPKGHEGKAKNEQFASTRREKKRKIGKNEKQQESSSQTDRFACPISLALGSNVSGALQDSPSGGWMEETDFPYSRKQGNISKEHREHLLGASIERELDNKIDRDAAMVKRQNGGFVGEVEGLDSPRIKTVYARSSSPLYHRLARVDPIVDFFAVDEELFGRFRICSCLPHQITKNSGTSISAVVDGGGWEEGIQQQAIIFKIKTTRPYSFWVRPIYGLMRPNVMAWVEVKCDLKANSLAKLEQDIDEFLVEICPVPGALQTMTNDLYTSCVLNNVPDLLSMWERAEIELKENQQQLQGFVKEFHRVTCRFQRSSLSSSIQPLVEFEPSLQHLTSEEQKEKRDITVKDNGPENVENNNVKIFQWNPFNSQAEDEERYRLAREFSHNHSDEGKSQEQLHHRHHGGGGEKTSRCFCLCCFGSCRCCNSVRKLCCLSFILTLLLLAALSFIFYTQYNQYFDKDKSSNNDNKNAMVSVSNKRYVYR